MSSPAETSRTIEVAASSAACSAPVRIERLARLLQCPPCPLNPGRRPRLRARGNVALRARLVSWRRRAIATTASRLQGGPVHWRLMFSHGSKNRLTPHDLARFPGATLFDRLARAVCRAGCLPRKELYEAWETARRVRRKLRGGRVIDIAGGHGLLACTMLLLDDSSPGAVVVDPDPPASAQKLAQVVAAEWPRLAGRIDWHPGVESVAVRAGDVVVSCHACGALSDRVLDIALAVRTSVAVLPCCHERQSCDAGALEGWLDFAPAVDVVRALRLEREGYRVWTQIIPQTITPKNRLLIGVPR